MRRGTRSLLLHNALPSVIGAALLLSFLAMTGLDARIDDHILSAWFRLRATFSAPDPGPVTVISLRADPEGPHRQSRSDHADLLDQLVALPSARRPRAVVVDLGFYAPPCLEGACLSVGETAPSASHPPHDSPPSPPENELGHVERRILATQRALGTVVNAYEFVFEGPGDGDPDPAPDLAAQSIPYAPVAVAGASDVVAAHPTLRTSLHGSASLGFANAHPSDARGELGLFSLPLLVEYTPTATSPRRLYPSLALAGAAVALCGPVSALDCLDIRDGALFLRRPDGELRLDPRRLPINYRRRFLEPSGAGERWYERASKSRDGSTIAGPPGTDLLYFWPSPAGGEFVTTAGEVLEAPDFGLQSLVVIDHRERPALQNPLGIRLLPGATHAQALSNLLEGDLLTPWPRESGPLIALALVTAAIALRSRRRRSVDHPRGRRLGDWGPTALYARSFLLSPEGLLGAGWIVASLISLTAFSHAVPTAIPAAALAGCLVGWRLWLPRQLQRDARATQRLLDARRHQIAGLSRTYLHLAEAIQENERLQDDARALAQEAIEGLRAIVHRGGEVSLSALPSPELYRALGLTAPDVEGVSRACEKAQRGVAELRHIAAELERCEPHQNGLELLRGQRELYGSLLTHYERLIHRVDEALSPFARLNQPKTKRAEGAAIEEARALLGMEFGEPEVAARILKMVRRAAGLSAGVLILGETGTGKSRLAAVIHDQSSPSGPKGKPLRTIDCTTLAEGTLEGDFFGSVPGAFTGALDRAGLFETANGATIFLDEIGDLPLVSQPKLLRVIQTGMVRRLGDTKDRKADFRLICATHRDLKEMVADGTFRADLYHRLVKMTIRVPPLRERPGDIAPIARATLDRTRGAGLELSTEVAGILERRAWPGNIRELEGAVEVLGLVASERLAAEGGLHQVTLADLIEAEGRVDDGDPPTARVVDRTGAERGPTKEEVAIFGRRCAGRLPLHRRCEFSWVSIEGDPSCTWSKATFHYDLLRNATSALLAAKGSVETATRHICGDEASDTLVAQELERAVAWWRELMAAAEEAGVDFKAPVHPTPAALKRLKDWLRMKLSETRSVKASIELVRETQLGRLPAPPASDRA